MVGVGTDAKFSKTIFFLTSSDEHLHSRHQMDVWNFLFRMTGDGFMRNHIVGVPVHRWLMPVGSDLTLWKQCDELWPWVCLAKMDKVNKVIETVNEELIEHSNTWTCGASFCGRHHSPNDIRVTFQYQLLLQNIRLKFEKEVEHSRTSNWWWNINGKTMRLIVDERRRRTTHLCRYQSARNLLSLTSKCLHQSTFSSVANQSKFMGWKILKGNYMNV